MRGWGEVLSEDGYAVAVPDLPYFSAHADNAGAIVDLVAYAERTHPDRIDTGRLVLVGFSAGGLATAVAAESLPQLDLWIGLDPVDAGGRGVTAAERVGAPGVALFAEPAGCNADGNGQEMASGWLGPTWSATVRGATHCDPERPSNTSCAVFCGPSEPARSDAFVAYTSAAISAVLSCDGDAIAALDLGGSDVRLAGRRDRSWVDSVRRRCEGAATYE
jgi:pimeloyl-ACP methyl ester carboxylesterase